MNHRTKKYFLGIRKYSYECGCCWEYGWECLSFGKFDWLYYINFFYKNLWFKKNIYQK